MKEIKRVGSFNLTDAGYQALHTLEKKTGKSRKEIVSSALTAALGTTLNQAVVTFRLPDPEEIMLLRSEIVNLESSAADLKAALFGLRPKDKETAKQLAHLISRIQEHINELRGIDNVFKQKQHLLKSLSFAEYKAIPSVISAVEKMVEAAKGKHGEAGRQARAELMLKILKIIA
jgi:hypothetical protein